MNIYTYDIEVFPNFFLAVIVDFNDFIKYTKDIDNKTIVEKIAIYESIPTKIFTVYDDYNNLFDFVTFINQRHYLISFNGLDYDDIITKLIISKVSHWKTNKQTLRDIYEMSGRVINSQNNQIQDQLVNYLRYQKAQFLSIDVQKVFGLNKIKKSLKQTLINVKWYNIEDYNMPQIEDRDPLYYEIDQFHYRYINQWDRTVFKEYISGIVSYCKNDTLGTCEIAKRKLDEISLRINSSIKYNVNILSSSESNMADRIFEKLYCDASGIEPKVYNQGRTYWKYIDVKDCIPLYIKFTTEPYIDLLKYLRSLRITNTKDELEYSFTDKNISFQIGTGGLHSKDMPGIFTSNEEYILRDADVTSFYPFIVKYNRICPKHLNTDIFIGTTSIIIDDRVKAKRAKDKTTADALKIVINSGIFGKMGHEFSPVYDRKAMVSVTFIGQLSLLMLIEALNKEEGLEVISANTDGIVTKIRRDKETVYNKICNSWSNYTKYNLEYVDYDLYIRKNVNSYFCIKTGSSPVKERMKFKGELNPNLFKEDLRKGFNHPIVPLAIIEYFTNNIPIIDTINSCKDIFLFTTTTKPNDTDFAMEYHKIIDGKLKIIDLTKNNRYFISTDGGTLLKRRKGIGGENGNYKIKGKYSNVIKGYKITIFNQAFDVDNFKDYNINYGYYYTKARDIINVIKTSQNRKILIKKNLDQLNLF